MRSLLVAVIISLDTTASFAADSCGDILRDGTFSKIDYKSNKYARLVIAAKFSRMTKSQADSHVAANGNLPIDGMPVGGAFTDDEFRSWQQDIKNTLDVDQILKDETQLVAASGDTAIVNAWKSCMQSRSGLAVRFEEFDAKHVALSVTYFPYPGQANALSLTSDVSLVGGSFQSGKELLLKKAKLSPSVEVQALIQRNSGEPLIALLNSPIGSARSYLPKQTPVPVPAFVIKVRNENVLSGSYTQANKGLPLSSAHPAAQKIRIKFAPKEEPRDLSNLLGNVTFVSGDVHNTAGTLVANLSPGMFLLSNPNWDPASSTLTIDWNTGIINNVNDVSDYSVTATVQIAYKVPNPSKF